MRKIQILIVLAAAVGAAWLTSQVDNGMGPGWAHNVVRNWEQFGFFNLNGQMVVNPGGFQADTKPEIYPGHRPASMYPAFFCHHLFAATGLGFFAYYAVTAAMVLLSIWWLLGRTERAFWLAAMAVILPGYIRWQTELDPNLTAVLFGYPFCAAAIWLLRRPRLNWRQTAALFALIVIFSAINWTTVFVHAMFFMTLLVMPRIPWRNLFIYAGLTAVAGGGVVLMSVASKMARADGSSGGLSLMLSAYGWGNTGYGAGMTTQTAILRLVAANVIGLLPLLGYLGWQMWRRGFRRAATGLLGLLPLLVPAVEALGMRNYFGHHPWMSVNFFLMGIILAMVAWKDRAGVATAGDTTRLPVRLAWLAAVFAYSFVVLAAGHAHNDRELALVTFIRQHTERDATIVIRRDTDPALAELASRLDELFDRHLVVVPDAVENNLAGVPAKRMFLTATARTSEKMLAQTDGTDSTSPALKKLLDWYASHIAHRRVGDKLDIGEQYFLYPSND